MFLIRLYIRPSVTTKVLVREGWRPGGGAVVNRELRCGKQAGSKAMCGDTCHVSVAWVSYRHCPTEGEILYSGSIHSFIHSFLRMCSAPAPFGNTIPWLPSSCFSFFPEHLIHCSATPSSLTLFLYLAPRTPSCPVVCLLWTIAIHYPSLDPQHPDSKC